MPFDDGQGRAEGEFSGVLGAFPEASSGFRYAQDCVYISGLNGIGV